MPRTVLPVENCVFRLDSKYGFNQQFPMTFNDVELSEDGFEFDGINSWISFPSIPTRMWDMTIHLRMIWNGNGNDNDSLQQIIGNNDRYNEWIAIQEIDNGYTYMEDGMNSNAYQLDTYTLRIDVGVIYDIFISLGENNYKVLLNGEFVRETEKADRYNFNINAIGGRPDDRRFEGIISLVEIYYRAYTVQEMKDRYNQSTFLFLNNTPTPTQQAYLDWQNSRIIGRSR